MQAEFAAAPWQAVVAGRMLQSLFHVPWQAVPLRWSALSCWNSGTQVQKRIHWQCPATPSLVLYTPHKQKLCLLHKATLCPGEIKEYIHQGTGEGLPGSSEHTARSQLEQHSLVVRHRVKCKHGEISHQKEMKSWLQSREGFARAEGKKSVRC